MNDLNAISFQVIGTAMRIHTSLGPGLFESAYEVVLADALEQRAFHVERQKLVPITFEGRVLDRGFRVDLLVNGCVVVEVKSVPTLAPIHSKQVLTYIRLLPVRLGLLLNFGEPSLVIKRIANGI